MSHQPLTRPVGHPGVRGRRSQRGWVGMLVILIALVIVAYLAKDALTKYGLIPDMETVERKAGTAPARAPGPAAGAVERVDATTTTPASRTPMDAARGLENSLKEQSEKRGGGY